MITHIGQFECRILRDAMQIAAQFNNKARMRLDADGIHISAKNVHNSAAVWIDIPTTAFDMRYDIEDPLFENEVGIDQERIYRMVNAYDEDQEIQFSLESRYGVGELVKISGTGGTLRAFQTSLNHIEKVPDRHEILSAHPAPASGNKDAEIFRDVLHHEQEDNTHTISFIYDKEHERYTMWVEAFDKRRVLDNPKVPENIVHLQTTISLKLLQRSIEPECINGDIKFAFGNDTTLFMGARVNGCDVAMAIAPRID